MRAKDLHHLLKRAAEKTLETYKTARFKEAAALWIYQKLKEQRREKKSDFDEKKRRLITDNPLSS